MTKNRMKSLISNHGVEIVLGILLVSQILFLCWFNLFHTEDINDYDASGAYVHIIEMVKSHSLLPKHYLDATTMDIDSMAGVTAVIYAVIGNIFVAQGISNVLLIAAYLLVLWSICKRLHFDIKTFFVLGLLFFIPYYDNNVGINMTGYAAMQFINVAPNSVRNLIPLLYLSFVLDHNAGEQNIPKGILSVFLMVLTSVSAGYYVFAFGILSIIVGDIVWVEFSGEIKNIKNTAWMWHILMAVACVVGLIVQRLLGFTSRMGAVTKVTAADMPSNTQRWFVGIFELYGGVTNSAAPIASIGGIKEVFSFAIAAFFLFAVLYYLVRWFRDKKLPRHMYYILCICIIDGVALNLLNLTYGSETYEARYHIMPMLMVMLLSANLINELWKMDNALLRSTIVMIGAVVLVLVGALDNRRLYIDMQQASDAKELRAIADYLEDEQVDVAIVCTNNEYLSARKLRAYVNQTNVVTPYKKCNPLWGGSSRVVDNSDQTGKLVLLTTKREYNKMKPYYKAGTTYLDKIGMFQIYSLDKSTFDCIAGLTSYDDNDIDFPYTPGYVLLDGTIDQDGAFVASGADNFALSGLGYTGVDGTWNYTLEYEILPESTVTEGAYFTVTDNQVPVGSVFLEQGASSATMTIDVSSHMNAMDNRVYVPKGMKIRIRSIKMERSK